VGAQFLANFLRLGNDGRVWHLAAARGHRRVFHCAARPIIQAHRRTVAAVDAVQATDRVSVLGVKALLARNCARHVCRCHRRFVPSRARGAIRRHRIADAARVQALARAHDSFIARIQVMLTQNNAF
jgi:hypothetical protein